MSSERAVMAWSRVRAPHHSHENYAAHRDLLHEDARVASNVGHLFQPSGQSRQVHGCVPY